MRRNGQPAPELLARSGADALREAAVHQATGSALAAVNTMGMAHWDTNEAQLPLTF